MSPKKEDPNTTNATPESEGLSRADERPKKARDWIATRIAAARAKDAVVPDGVATRVGDLLRGDFGQHSVGKPAMRKTAKELLKLVVSPSSTDGGSQ